MFGFRRVFGLRTMNKKFCQAIQKSIQNKRAKNYQRCRLTHIPVVKPVRGGKNFIVLVAPAQVKTSSFRAAV